MAIELGPMFPPQFQGTPPGMVSGDLELWHRWRRIYASAYLMFWFNVRLITPVACPPGTPPEIQRSADLNAAWRIDVVARAADHVALIELRLRAGFSSVGQLVGYSHFWRREGDLSLPIRLLLVSDTVAPAVRATAESLQIEIVLV